MIKLLSNILKGKGGSKSSTILSDRLEVRTRVANNANPLLYIIEDRVKELLLDKYKDEFTLNNLETKKINPDYQVNADVEYPEMDCYKKGFFGKKKKKSKDVLNNRLEIRIKANQSDNIFKRIKIDINELIYQITEKEANKVIVERDFCHDGGIETIKILIALE